MKTETITIRNAQPGEQLPESLLGKWSCLKLDAQWIWVAESEGNIEGLVITSVAHGALFIWRVAATENAPKNWLRTALRAVIREAAKRGIVLIMSYLQPSRGNEYKLLRIAWRAKWVCQSEAGVWIAGSL